MEGHVKLLAILYMVFGALGVLAALACLVLFGSVAGVVSATLGDDPEARIAVPVLGIIGGIMFVIALFASLPAVAAGVGLMNYKEWARILTIVLSVFALFVVPLGTLLGIYGFWVLFNQQTITLFNRGQVPAARA